VSRVRENRMHGSTGWGWKRNATASPRQPPTQPAVGGISGPLLFGALIENASESGDITGIAFGYFLGAALMIAGGVVEIFLGVKAEGQSLESIAMPLTAEDDETPSTEDERAKAPA